MMRTSSSSCWRDPVPQLQAHTQDPYVRLWEPLFGLRTEEQDDSGCWMVDRSQQPAREGGAGRQGD
jgi:hypothetical protein